LIPCRVNSVVDMINTNSWEPRIPSIGNRESLGISKDKLWVQRWASKAIGFGWLFALGVIGLVSSSLVFGRWGGLLFLGIWMVSIRMISKIPVAWVMRSHLARAIHPRQAPELYKRVHVLGQRMGLPSVPVLFLVNNLAPVAFTYGDKEQAGIALSTGLLSRLEWNEIEAVLAHELSHLRANDTKLMFALQRFRTMLSWFSLFGIMLLVGQTLGALFGKSLLFGSTPWLLMLAPAGAWLAIRGISRQREFQADLQAAEHLGDAHSMLSALLKLDDLHRDVQPLTSTVESSIPVWFRTHPSTEERVSRLRDLLVHADVPLVLEGGLEAWNPPPVREK
jgi:heat shock protein HtpX